MSSIAVPQETVERILRQQRTVAVLRELKVYLAYFGCVLETGSDWDNPDCLRIIYGSPEPPPPGEELLLLEELLAQMPEDEQQQVATSMLEAQARLRDQYIPEIEEWIRRL